MARRRKGANPHNDTQILSVDTSAWEKMVNDLRGKEVYTAIRSGFRRAVAVLRTGIQKEIRSCTRPHRKGIKVWTRRGSYYPRAIWRDVKISVFRSVIGANVSLCNPRNPDNRAYILRMLNAGASNRATKKGVNRGSLRTLNFFERGINASKDKAVREIDKKIKTEIMKKVTSLGKYYN